jgi:hypothetical protein
MKAFTVHFKAFRLSAITTYLLDFVNLLGLLSISSFYIKAHRRFRKYVVDGRSFILSRELDIHPFLTVFLGDEG